MTTTRAGLTCTRRPLIADLFCGAGGAAMGLHRAGFDVVGFDTEPQPRYPFDFVRQDALTVKLDAFDAVWASPPCQAYSWASGRARKHQGHKYPDLIAITRDLLQENGKIYVIENVVGAPVHTTVSLSGEMFGLAVARRRHFESNVLMLAPRHRANAVPIYTVAGHGGVNSSRHATDGPSRHDRWSEAMGIDWMTKRELTQAIPPAYSEYLGRQLMQHLTA